MRKAKVAVIGGTGFKDLFKGDRQLRIGTPYGIAPQMSLGRMGDMEVVFLPRHGPAHSVPPHMINYRANVYALYSIGVERVVAVNAVGAINLNFKPGDVVVPHDFIDFTRSRRATFYDDFPVTHVDFSQPYCPELRKLIVEHAKSVDLPVRDKAVLVCTEGPRFETPAEIEMFRRLGCDVVGMTGLPEAVLAMELEMCYAALCFVSNMAAGVQAQLTPGEVADVSEKIMPRLEQALIEAVKALPSQREGNCSCADALRNARIK